MPTCTIDGQVVSFEPGENLVEVAKKAGIEIPVFCYHPALTVVAQCRMCAVEIEKMPKLQTACSTAAADGMVVHTKSEKAKQNRESVMEFLLVNHPLDCPICDKSGECDLQDHSYDHGSALMRGQEDRRTYLDLDMGPVIQKNMNRCIHCTRCIRFGEEVAGIREMVALQRGNNTEITTLDGAPLQTEYAGNYADICPTGSLTLKDFRFHKRAWMLKKTSSICTGCSRGCALEVQHDRGVIHRTVARTNKDVNQYWICDEGRFLFRNDQKESRYLLPSIWTSDGAQKNISWDESIGFVNQVLQGKRVLALVGTDLTLEEMALIQKQMPQIPGVASWKTAHFGTPGHKTSQDDQDQDKILKRTSKTGNLHGAEALEIPAFDGNLNGFDLVWIFRGGRAVVPFMTFAGKVLAWGVFHSDESLPHMDALLPGPAQFERKGSYVNFQKKKQTMDRAVLPPSGVKELPEIILSLSHKKSSQSQEGVA